ncbi:hypothetical protein chiPu_0017747 [Chiloscyllium punctatum]|uniref:CUB domain-containing protein n=1 Tax=Chiloscyllium punctatum TaxID=137246 RepID=A0A401RIJ3_CHIPU|nr:hypothetical protein [Chiloscyllium punctatum]
MPMEMWIIVSLLLMRPAFCSNSLDGFHGQFTSLNYPQGYPDNVQQSWDIQVPRGYGIKLYFSHINIEPSANCAYDYVQIFCDEATHSPICGNSKEEVDFQVPQEYHTTGNWMKVTFKSNFSNEERHTGFVAHYAAVDVDECKEENPCNHYCNNYIGGFNCSCRPGYFLQENQRTCAVNCGPPSKLTNGRENFTSTVYRHWNTYSCEEPYYELEGNAVFECSADAEWVDVTSGQPTMPKCKPGKYLTKYMKRKTT